MKTDGENQMRGLSSGRYSRSIMSFVRNIGLLLIAGLLAIAAARAQQAPPSSPTAPQSVQPGTVPAVSPAHPVAQAPPTSGPRGVNVAPDYQIGPGDSLEINVWKEPTISGTVPVRPDGMISLPLVGDMQAAGLTPMNLADQISEHLKKFINQPTVTVTVMGVNSKHIYMIGEISKPGEQELVPGMNVLQAIASAGGLTPYASKKLYILRGTAGKQQKIPFDYKKAIRDGDMQGVTLISGDTIVVR